MRTPLTEAFEAAMDIRRQERAFMRGERHTLTAKQIEALRRRMQRAKGFPLYTATVGGRKMIVSIPEEL